jgi:hypothetical protein
MYVRGLSARVLNEDDDPAVLDVVDVKFLPSIWKCVECKNLQSGSVVKN